MNCQKVQFLMSLYIADDPGLPAETRTAFQEHLADCQECTQEFEASRVAIALARRHWSISHDTLSLIEKAGQPVGLTTVCEEDCQRSCVSNTERPNGNYE